MKKPFNIFLDSSCPKSKKLYPKNNNMEFTIDLPERMDFRRNWHVALKSLFIPNKFVTFDDCYVKYYYYNWPLFDAIKLSILTRTKQNNTCESYFINQIFLENK